MSDKPIEKNKLAIKSAFKIKPVGLAAAKARATNAPKDENKKEFVPIPLEKAEHKIGIVFDDSGSMIGAPITDAHDGVEEFVKNCNPHSTALSVYPMNEKMDNSGSWLSGYHDRVQLTTDLISVVKKVKTYAATGGTPLYETTLRMLENEALTRGIVFSDGSPNHNNLAKEQMFEKAKEKKIAIDVVYIGSSSDDHAIACMQEIAERTGGVFIIFERGKVNFRTAFKYLTPGYRALLMDKSFKEKLEKGEIK